MKWEKNSRVLERLQLDNSYECWGIPPLPAVHIQLVCWRGIGCLKQHFECWLWGETIFASPAGNPSYITVLTGWSFSCPFMYPLWYNGSIRYRKQQAKNLLAQWTLQDYKTYLYLQIFLNRLICSPRHTNTRVPGQWLRTLLSSFLAWANTEELQHRTFSHAASLTLRSVSLSSQYVWQKCGSLAGSHCTHVTGNMGKRTKCKDVDARCCSEILFLGSWSQKINMGTSFKEKRVSCMSHTVLEELILSGRDPEQPMQCWRSYMVEKVKCKGVS